MATERQIHAGMLTLSARKDGDVRTLGLSGELDLANADSVDSELQAAFADGDCQVVVDMSELTFIDSTGIALLITALAQDPDGRRLRFVPSRAEGVARVLQLTGVDERLPLVAVS